MAEKVEGESRTTQHLIRNLLFTNFIGNKFEEEVNEDEEEIELTLGLSLNGRFGVDPKKSAKNKLARSSSVADITNPIKKNEDASCLTSLPRKPLIRTCSLPAKETEEKLRKRKDLQSLRRMEAKRKRCEKQRNLKALREQKRGFAFEKEDGILDQQEQCAKILNRFSSLRIPSLAPSSRRGGGGASKTEFDGTSDSMAMRSSSTAKPIEGENDGMKEILRNVLEDMPCVFTQGDRPDGKRVDGFLYRYRKGEDVRIVCVCHGRFFTPAEFVEHAGGTDLEHPLKHIVVNPTLL